MGAYAVQVVGIDSRLVEWHVKIEDACNRWTGSEQTQAGN